MHKLFNRNTVKIAYSCMPNMARLIKAHNKRVLHPPTPDKDCNCRIKNSCPLKGKCQADNVIYQAMVSDDTRNAKVYTGMSAPPFKARYSNHLTTLRHDRYENSTELSKHVWSMKRDNIQYVIDWKIRDRATSFDNTSKRCGLCTTKKYHILETDARTRLNKPNEIVSKCRHESKYVLSNFVPIT